MARIPGLPPLTEAERAEIVQRYRDGDVVLTLCAAYRRAKTTIKAVLREAGVEMRPAGYAKGTKTWTPEWRAAHHQGTHTDEFRQKSRANLLRRLPSMRGPATNSPIEQRLHDAFRKVGIGFSTQSLMLDRHLVDIEVHQAPIIIEADGAQHTLRERREKDKVRDAELAAAGYRVFRFTGSEINRDSDACIARVVTECGLTPDEEPVYNIRTKFAGATHPNWKGGEQEHTCQQCGKVFLKQPSQRQSRTTFCDSKCYGESMRGKPQSAEHLAKRIEGMARARATKRSTQIKIESEPA